MVQHKRADIPVANALRLQCRLGRESTHCPFLWLTGCPRRYRIVVLSGDGIGMADFIICFTDADLWHVWKGPEVVDEAVKALNVVSENSPDFDLKLEKHLFGGCAIDATGEALPSSTLKACQEANPILMG